MARIKVDKRDDYYIVVATERIPEKDVLLRLEGIVLKEPTQFSIQIGESEHIAAYSNHPHIESSIIRYINHSCEPSAYFNITDRVLIAAKNLEPGDEITFNYNTTEYDMVAPFQCRCGSANCYGEIKGFKYLSADQKNKLLPFISPYLKKYL